MKKILTLLNSLLIVVISASSVTGCHTSYQPVNNEIMGAKINKFLLEHFQVFPNLTMPYDAIKIKDNDSDSAYFQNLTVQEKIVANLNPILNFAYDNVNDKYIVDNIDEFAINTNDIQNKATNSNQLLDIYKLYLATDKNKLPTVDSLQSKLLLFLANNETFNYSVGTVLLPIVSDNKTQIDKIFYFESINLPSKDFWAAQLGIDTNNYFAKFLPTEAIFLPKEVIQNPTAENASQYFFQQIYNAQKLQSLDYKFFANINSVNTTLMYKFLEQYFQFNFSLNSKNNTFSFTINNKENNKIIISASHSYSE